MGRFIQELKDFMRKGDLVLLLLCLVTTAFGCLIIASATNAMGYTRYLVIQILAALLGVALYIIISSIDVDTFSEHRSGLVIFNTVLLLLLIPFGTDVNGNRSWLDFPFLPINIQPAEICKITYIMIMASVMSSHQNRLSSISSVAHMVFHLILIVGMNMVLSGDAGVSLIFVFIFIGMAFAGGVHIFWFILAGTGLAVAVPILWNYVIEDYQRKRFQVLWDATIDPLGIDKRWHMKESLESLTGGGFTGQGLFQGNRTQADALTGQHTDFIFSAIGEELGFIGCALALALLLAIIIRCIYVAVRTPDFQRRLVCFGAASALIFQVCINVGMCIGVSPVIGLTLPFISYGGSSIVTIYAMLGLVSGVHARPVSGSHERYIRPYR